MKKNKAEYEADSVTKASPRDEEKTERDVPSDIGVNETKDITAQAQADEKKGDFDTSPAKKPRAPKKRNGKKSAQNPKSAEVSPSPVSEAEEERRSIERISGHERVEINENIRLFEPDVEEKKLSDGDEAGEFSRFARADGFLKQSDLDADGERIVKTDATVSEIPDLSTEDEFAKLFAKKETVCDGGAENESAPLPDEKAEGEERPDAEDSAEGEEVSDGERSEVAPEGESEAAESVNESYSEQSDGERREDIPEENENATDGSGDEKAEDGAASLPEEKKAEGDQARPEKPLQSDKGEKDSRKEQSEKKKGKKIPRYIDGLFDFVELFAFTLVSVLVVTAFFFRHSVVDGDSMVGTLHDGENLIISNLFYDPEPMDIIVFEDHATGLNVPVVKRIIATEGQKVRVTPTEIIVDGKALDERGYAYFEGGYNKGYSTSPHEKFYNTDRYPDLVIVIGEYYEFTVPEGELFVLGDNRNISHDSRSFGTIKEDSIFGRVLFRFYPFDKFGAVD